MLSCPSGTCHWFHNERTCFGMTVSSRRPIPAGVLVERMTLPSTPVQPQGPNRAIRRQMAPIFSRAWKNKAYIQYFPV